MRFADLTAEQYKTLARQPRIDAYKRLLDAGFDPEEAVEAFREMCGLVDGVTA